jgi:hypothetical protein
MPGFKLIIFYEGVIVSFLEELPDRLSCGFAVSNWSKTSFKAGFQDPSVTWRVIRKREVKLQYV